MSDLYQPTNTIEALAWAQRHNATIRYLDDGDVEIYNQTGHRADALKGDLFYAYGDSLVTSVCKAITDAYELTGIEYAADGIHVRDDAPPRTPRAAHCSHCGEDVRDGCTCLGYGTTDRPRPNTQEE